MVQAAAAAAADAACAFVRRNRTRQTWAGSDVYRYGWIAGGPKIIRELVTRQQPNR